MTAQFCIPQRILYGRGAIRALAPLMSKLGYRAPLLVTDRYFTGQSNVARELVSSLRAAGLHCEVTDLGQPDPSVELCREVLGTVVRGGSQPDCVIALGGGSNMDLAKALSVLLRHGGDVGDYIGEGKLPKDPLPLVAITTTSGTGSEITAGSILVGEGGSVKVALMGNQLRPCIAVADPELTDSCPQKVTAESGADAITHAIECYLLPDPGGNDDGVIDVAYSGATELTRLLSLEAVRRLAVAVPRAVRDGGDRGARDDASYGSLLASLAYGNAGLHAVHAIAYALADITHRSHGATNAVLLPYVMDELRVVATGRLADIARALDPAAPCDPETAARRACVATRELLAGIGMQTNLREFGLQEGDLGRLAAGGAAVARLTKAYPIQPAEPSYRRIVQNAYTGRFSFEVAA